MKGKNTYDGIRDLSIEEQIKRAKKMKIDYSDIPKLGPDFWANAKWVMPPQKVAIGVRFDKDVIEWFKSFGDGYQTKMNAVLRLYMDNHKDREINPPSPPKRKKK